MSICWSYAVGTELEQNVHIVTILKEPIESHHVAVIESAMNLDLSRKLVKR